MPGREAGDGFISRPIARTEVSVRDSQSKTPERAAVSSTPLVRKPRHKWFSTYDKDCGDGWWGPHDTVEAAARECVCNAGRDQRIFIAHGHKLREAERYSEFAWEVDAKNAFEIILPNAESSNRLSE